uniref:Bromo domain-containing protein n=1 Tax=Lygus hesperus TaxID=30085 RepID=A0A0A9X7W9_LYGHE
MEGTDTENSIPWDGGGSASGKKKKGRRKVSDEIVYASLPEHAIIEKDEQVVAELQAAYRILQSINSIKHITPFYDEPTQDKFGMSSYFSIIKKPMWLNEVRRKIECGEYEGLHDFVADLHLILYNCYKFWGETHRISFRGYIIEHKIETQLAEIPWSVREKIKCPVSTGDCIICDKTSNGSFEDEDGTNSVKEDVVNNPDLVYYNSKGYVSRIVTKLLNEEEEEIEAEEETEEAKEERLKMEKWEQETLNKLEGASDISHIPELVDIGLFLKLTHEVLNVEEMTQYEVERMLLIPLESATLQTLMTSILSPEWRRNNLDETPLMPYNVWNSKLRQRITSWFKVYYKHCDSIETFERLGIDPYFWSIVNLVNPMATDIPFHELPFYVRIWVFKTLLDNIFHTNKTIVDLFLDESGDPNRFRHSYLGKGLMNNHYKAVPTFLPEIRIYKEMSPLLSVWTSAWDDADHGIEKIQRNRMTFIADSNSFGPNNKTFELVASDLDNLNELIKFGEFQDLQDLAAALTKFKEEVETSHIRCEGLKSIYKQYHNFHSRTCEYFTNMENLWFSYTNDYNKPIKEEKKEDDASETLVLGKRRNTPSKLVLKMAEGYSSESGISENEQSESDISDWESTYKNHQRKKKLRPSKKAKLLKARGEPPKESPDNPPTPIENGLSSQDPEPIKVEKKESALMTEFKMEPMETESASCIQQDNIKIEKDVDGPSIAATLSLGTVKEDSTVVILSSDDEDDVKPPIAKLKLRDVTTLLESPPPSGPSPDNNSMNSPPNNMVSNMTNCMVNNLPNSMVNNLTNTMVNNLPNNMANNMVNNLNVVIPPMPVNSNPLMGMNPMMGMNRPMSVQVPPNLYQVRAPRQRMQQINPRQMMTRSPMRGIAPRPQMSPRPVRMPVPKPITPKKPVPKPLLMSPQEWANTPPPTSPNTPPSRGRPVGGSPRGRSPVTPPQQRMWSNNVGSPRNRSPMIQQGRGMTPTKTVGIPPKALFPAADSAEAAEGKLIMGPNETGTGYGYQIVLPDGGIRYLTDAEVNAIKRKNSGTLPRRVRIPPDGSFL